MSEISYKVLAAKRLHCMPEEFAFYRETESEVIVTTLPDQVEHTFTKMELLNPVQAGSKPAPDATQIEPVPAARAGAASSNIAEKPQKGPDPASAAPQLVKKPTKNRAKKQQ